MDDRERLELFEQTVLPHLDAAYNLARWLVRNDEDANDIDLQHLKDLIRTASTV